MFDVIVIGGNLAGATAAINAASENINVALVERNKEPFDPAHCGELIPDTVAKSLDLDKIGCPKNEINKVIIDILSKKYVINFNKQKMIIFNRNFVEKELLKNAETKGVKLIIGNGMKDFKPPHEVYLENKKIIRGKIIIDASGIACQVGRRIGINTKLNPKDIGVCIQSRVISKFDENTVNMWFHRPYAPFGYSWIFPINEKMANIGLGVLGGQKLDLAILLKKYIKNSINETYKIINTFRACEPIAPPLNELTKNNVMIVGDAARLVYPESGGGIENALFSARIAGLTAAKYINGEISSLNNYQKALRVKLLRLRNSYKRKERASKSDEKFIKTYQHIFSLLCFINKLFPNFSHFPIINKLENL